jgi:hypothetical protein
MSLIHPSYSTMTTVLRCPKCLRLCQSAAKYTKHVSQCSLNVGTSFNFGTCNHLRSAVGVRTSISTTTRPAAMIATIAQHDAAQNLRVPTHKPKWPHWRIQVIGTTPLLMTTIIPFTPVTTSIATITPSPLVKMMRTVTPSVLLVSQTMTMHAS